MATVTGVTTEMGTRSDKTTWTIRRAEAIALEGIEHRVGDEVLVADWHGRWAACPITCIRTTGATGRVWVLDVQGSAGETTRKPAKVRVLASRRLLAGAA